MTSHGGEAAQSQGQGQEQLQHLLETPRGALTSMMG